MPGLEKVGRSSQFVRAGSMEARVTVNRGSLPPLPDVGGICRQFRVSSLDVFGSATSDRFDPARSDIDLLVVFETMPSDARAASYFGLHDALEAAFARKIDLITEKSVENPYLRHSIAETRRRLFPAIDADAAAGIPNIDRAVALRTSSFTAILP